MKSGVGEAVLVTGATGFIGRRLRRRDERALVRVGQGWAGEVVGDLLDPTSLARACEGIKTIFHCAGYAHAFASSDRDVHWRVNFDGTRNLIEAARMAGVRRFILLSTMAAMGRLAHAAQPVDEDFSGEVVDAYGAAKRAAEMYLREASDKHGLEQVIIRPPLVYGRGDPGNMARMMRGIRAGWFPPLPETDNRRSLVHVDDLVAAMRLVAERPQANGRTYIVAYSQAYSAREVYDAIRAALAVPSAPIFRVPAWLVRAGGLAGDALGLLLRRSMPLNSEVVERLLGSACYSPARLERELGWRARIGLEDGLREMIGCVR